MGPWPLVIAISGQRGEDGATLREVDNFSRIHRVCGHISQHIKKAKFSVVDAMGVVRCTG